MEQILQGFRKMKPFDYLKTGFKFITGLYWAGKMISKKETRTLLKNMFTLMVELKKLEMEIEKHKGKNQ